jgi:CRP-like cAMP-binding protein
MEVTPGTHGSAGENPNPPPFLEGSEGIELPRNQVIGRRAALCSRLLIVDSGFVLLKSPDTSEFAPAYLLGPGDPLGEECFQPGAAWKNTATALTAVRAYAFPGVTIPRVCRQFPGLAAYVLSRIQRRKSAAPQHVAQIQSRSEMGRVFGFMQLVADRFGSASEWPSRRYFPLNENDLSPLLGVSQETIQKTLAEREEEGQVGRDARRRLWVNVVSSCTLALVLAARVIGGPSIPVTEYGDTVLVPVRGRRGRSMKVPERLRLPVLSAGPYPWTVAQAG